MSYVVYVFVNAKERFDFDLNVNVYQIKKKREQSIFKLKKRRSNLLNRFVATFFLRFLMKISAKHKINIRKS